MIFRCSREIISISHRANYRWLSRWLSCELRYLLLSRCFVSDNPPPVVISGLAFVRSDLGLVEPTMESTNPYCDVGTFMISILVSKTHNLFMG